MANKLVLILALLVVADILVSADDAAHLIVQKLVLDKQVVIGKEATVKLQIFNVGTSSAYSIALTDEEWKESEVFEVIGADTIEVEKLIPGGNFTHEFVVLPVKDGKVSIPPAYIKYQVSEKGAEQEGYSNDLKLRVLSRKFVDRDMSSYLWEWGIFAAMALVPVLVPLFIWVFIKLKYENGIAKKSKTA